MPIVPERLYCGNENRRELVRTTLDEDDLPILNGIDYLEIDPATQTRLIVHFLHPLSRDEPLLSENITISGGDRIPTVHVASISQDEERLLITVDSQGDFSNYVLSLVTGLLDTTPPVGFDPALSRIQFSFKAACPSDFDCKEETSCPPTDPESARVDYLARDYQSYRNVLLDRMKLLMPNWRESSPADFPVAYAELLAYLGDQLTYTQESAATEAYLGRSLHRISVRRHARLRDYAMHEGSNSRTWVYLNVEPGGGADGTNITVGEKFFAGTRQQLAHANAGQYSALNPEKSAIFEAMEELQVRAAHNRFEFYTWANDDCTLCLGATTATLRRNPDATLQEGHALVFQEMRDPQAPEESSLQGRLDHRWAVRLTDVIETEDPLTSEALYQIRWSSEDALPFALSLSTRVNDILIENITLALGNIILADHGLTIEDSEDQPSLAPRHVSNPDFYRPVLSESGITYCEPLAQPKNTPACLCIRQTSAQARPQVWLDTDGERWQSVPDLLNSAQDAAEFVVEIDNQRKTHIRFGDGSFGRRPSTGSDFTATFRIGNGPSGNLGSDAILAILRPGGGFREVRNPMPAVGGQSPETLEKVKQFAPVAFRTQQRAVTLEDYEAVALQHPGV